MPPSYALLGGFAIGARVALLWQHDGMRGRAQRQSARPTARRTHYAYRRRLTPLAGDKIDAPAECAIPFRPYCGGVATRTQNVSEYMLVLALCLVLVVNILARKCNQ